MQSNVRVSSTVKSYAYFVVFDTSSIETILSNSVSGNRALRSSMTRFPSTMFGTVKSAIQ